MPTGSTHIFDEEGVAEIEGIPLPAHFKAVYVEQTGGDSPLPPWQATSSYEFEIDVVDGRPVVAQFIARRPDPDLRDFRTRRCSSTSSALPPISLVREQATWTA